MADSKALYQEVILDHNRKPRNYGVLEHATHHAEGNNPLCGDHLIVTLNLDGERIDGIAFQGESCAICKASASMMTVAVKGKTRADAETLSDMYRKTRGAGFGAECKRRIMLGTYVLSRGYYDAYYLKAQRVRALIAEDFRRAFTEVDAIVTPVSPFPAFKIGEKSGDPMEMYLSDIYSVTGDLAGIPCMSVPCGATRAGLPVGMQILTRHFDEPGMFRLADAFEKAGGFAGN